MRLFILIFSFAFLFVSCEHMPALRQRSGQNSEVKKQLDELMSERANRAVTIDDIRTELQLVAGEVDSTRHWSEQKTQKIEDELRDIREQLKRIEKKLGESGKGTTVSWQNIWDRGESAFNSKKYVTATKQYKILLRDYPFAPVAEKAQFKLAETLFARKKYSDSILQYEELKKKYPSSKKLPASYLQQARAFAKIGKKKEARLFYGKVSELYPKSIEAKSAKGELGKLK